MKIAFISTSLSNLGIRGLSSYLQAKDHKTDLYLLYSREKEYSNDLLAQLKNQLSVYDFIGISAIAIGFKKAIQIAEQMKETRVPVAMGGVHATLVPEDCLQYVDMVCIGEGEEAIAELVRRIENGQDFYDVKNFWFKNNGHIIRNPVRPLIQNLDSLPFADYDAKNHFAISNNKLKRLEYPLLDTDHPSVEHRHSIFVYPTRGCPHRCIYCINSKLHELYDQLPGKFVRSLEICASDFLIFFQNKIIKIFKLLHC